MKSLSAILAILVAFFLATGALATQHEDPVGLEDEPRDDEAQTEFTLIAHTDNGGGYFTLEDEGQDQDPDQQTEDGVQPDGEQPEGQQEERNPTLHVPPNEEITITLRANDSMEQHNLRVDDHEGSPFVMSPGDEVEYNFTAPAEGTWEYWCEVHPQAMRGQIVVQETEEEEEEEERIDPFDPEDPADPMDPGQDPEEEPTPAPALIGLIAVVAFAGLLAARRRR